MKRLWHWLFPKPECVSKSELEVARIIAYQTGLAEGELLGRQALAEEIRSMFPHPLTADDAATVKARQVH